MDRAMRVSYSHRDLLRAVVEWFVHAAFPPEQVALSYVGQQATTCVRANVYYYVGPQLMAFTLRRSHVRAGCTYYPPTPFVAGNNRAGGPPVNVPLADLAARVDRDTAHIDTFDRAVRLSETVDLMSWAGPRLAAEKTAGFWHDAREEFIAKAWEPGRHVDWCLPHDERREICTSP